jgi:hypothetical protein
VWNGFVEMLLGDLIKFPLLFGEKSLKTVCFDASVFKKALKQTRVSV